MNLVQRLLFAIYIYNRKLYIIMIVLTYIDLEGIILIIVVSCGRGMKRDRLEARYPNLEHWRNVFPRVRNVL